MNDKSHLKKLRKNIVWPHNAALSYYGVNAPILISCSGPTYTDIDDVQYIDALAGVANVNLGYGQTKIIDAMKKNTTYFYSMREKLTRVFLFYITHLHAVKYLNSLLYLHGCYLPLPIFSLFYVHASFWDTS